MAQRWKVNPGPHAVAFRFVEWVLTAVAVCILFALVGQSLHAQTSDPDAIAAKVAIDSLAGRLADQVAATNKQVELVASLQAQNASLQAQNGVLQAKLDAAKPDPVMVAKAAWVDGMDAQCDTCRAVFDLGMAGKLGKFKGVLICCGPSTVPPTRPDTSIVYITPK